MMKQDLAKLIKIEEEYKKHPKHMEFIADLQMAWEVALNRIDPQKIEWNADLFTQEELSDTFHYAGIQPSPDFPDIYNRVFCVGSDGKAVSKHFGAPILLSYEPKSLEKLRDYEIREVSGEKIEAPFNLSVAIDNFHIPKDTPVYESVFFLPVPLENENYESHFFPMIGSSHPAVNYLVVENNLINAGQISSRGAARALSGFDKEMKEYYHKAKFTPDAIRDGKLILPEYEGRMIIISRPVQIKSAMPLLYQPSRHRDFRDFNEDRRMPALATRGIEASVNTVSIEQGMKSHQQSVSVKTEDDKTRPAVIYDIRCLGVRRTDIGKYTPEAIKGLFAMAYGI